MDSIPAGKSFILLYFVLCTIQCNSYFSIKLNHAIANLCTPDSHRTQNRPMIPISNERLLPEKSHEKASKGIAKKGKKKVIN